MNVYRLAALLLVCVFCRDAAAAEAVTARQLAKSRAAIKRYRASDGYYREPWRPQFHFTPERNWMNDPNGLVFHRGEWHLCYQHNPVGNEWGHMTWGHAVSRNLLNWKHLPLAIVEEPNEMIFSGSAVVDHRNSSGFGSADNPPLVAIYTSHKVAKPRRQSQSLAYSTDNGRSWTKYAGNPVIDLKIPNHRDPKVFWHEPTERWVMLVVLAAMKKVQIYGSDDFKSWDLLSEFGPAGAQGKPNWECPDLFELPIETANGEPTGNTAWVLEADMGGGSVAGGSGGEYFIGDFDGKRFTCTDPAKPAYWVDYGRDFYAPISWSDVPRQDGRRIWIGWMNNWQTHKLPTKPWRSAMSVPRALSLRETGTGLRLAQRPVRELIKLRRDRKDGRSDAVRGRELDLEIEVALNGNDPIELRVFKGASEETVIGYAPAEGELYVNRRRSGLTGFHKSFAGEYRAPLVVEDGVLDLRVLLDRSSVEVFAEGGTVVSTNRVFPKAGSDRVTLDAGGADIRRFDAWRMASVWRKKKKP